jgi:RimJ/RimL family protein N-acetyltransferase
MGEWIQPVTLAGRHVRLEPLAREHVPGLQQAAADGELWNLWYTSVPAPADTAAYVDKALALLGQGLALPFVVKDGDGTIVGSTRFGNVDADNRRVEIGWTWYARRVQRTALNTEAKRLLLAHAFEALGCVAVEFRTHWFNHASRNAIARLGAKQDGVLRRHLKMPDGTWRDTVVFSILDHEWESVKHHLDFKLAEGGLAEGGLARCAP